MERYLFPPYPRLLVDHNIIAHSDGMHGNVLKFKPPMCFTQENSTQVVEALDSVLSGMSHKWTRCLLLQVRCVDILKWFYVTPTATGNSNFFIDYTQMFHSNVLSVSSCDSLESSCMDTLPSSIGRYYHFFSGMCPSVELWKNLHAVRVRIVIVWGRVLSRPQQH